jgi:hypothetical protein
MPPKIEFDAIHHSESGTDPGYNPKFKPDCDITYWLSQVPNYDINYSHRNELARKRNNCRASGQSG